jgi:predicted GNAT family N-acyltransferase
MDPSDVDVRHAIEPERLPQLLELYAAEWWTEGRTVADVSRMLAASDLVVALIHRPSDRLVGFARVLSDDTYVALVLDVIVANSARRAGLGGLLMDAIVSHPRLAVVQSLELVCQPDLMPFYRRWGFTEQVGQSRLMRRTSDPRLITG